MRRQTTASLIVASLLLSAAAFAQRPTPARVAELLRDYSQLQNTPEAMHGGYVLDPTIRREAALTPALERAYSNALLRLTASELSRSVADENLIFAIALQSSRENDVATARLRWQTAKITLQQAQQSHPLDGASSSAVDEAQKAVDRAQAALTSAELRLNDAKAKRAEAEQTAKDADIDFQRTVSFVEDVRKARNNNVPPDLLRACSVQGIAIQRNTILVRFADGATKSEMDTVMQRNHVHPIAGMPEISLFIVELDPSPRRNETDDEHWLRLTRTIRMLSAEAPLVVSAVAQGTLHTASYGVITAITLRPCWAWFTADVNGTDSATLLRLQLAWDELKADRPLNSPAVDVAVLDAEFVANVDIPSLSTICVSHRGDHGSQVAGLLIGTSGNNALPSDATPVAKVVGCAVPVVRFDCEGDSAVAFVSILFALRDLLASHQHRIINFSLGYNWQDDLAQTASLRDDIQKMVTAQGSMVRDLLAQFENDTVIVSAAGNECSLSTCTEPAQWASPVNWAALGPVATPSETRQAENVIVVESVDHSGHPAQFSARNAHVAAPGVDLLTCMAGALSGTAKGTSLSAPIVSGIAAMILAQNPKLKPAQVISILKQSQTAATVDALTAIQKAKMTP